DPTMRRLGLWLALGLAALVAAAPAAAALAAGERTGSPVDLQKGGTFTAGELSAIPGGRAFPRDHEREEHEGSRRNVEKPKPKQANARSPRAADGGVVRDGEPAVSLASPLGFDGPSLNDAPAYPPDTQGDVGPTQFIAMVNGRVRSYDKTTGLADGALNADTDVFWSSVMTPGDNFTSDPHIRYDRLSGRWFAVMIDVPGSLGDLENRIMLAVSDGGTITSSTNFHFYSIPEGVANEFADYPTLGIDKNALYIGTNQFKTTGTQGFAGTNAYVVNKASLISGAPTATRFRAVSTPTGAGPFTPQGVDNDDPGATTGYFIGVDNANFGKLDLLTISTPGTTPTLSTQSLTVPATAYPLSIAASGVPTPNGHLDDLDDRLYAAQLQNGHIFTAHNIGVNSSGVASGSPTRDASRWYEINPGASPTLVQSGTVFDNSASNPRSYWIPTIAASRQGLVALGGSVAGAAHVPNAWFAARAPGEAPGTVGGLAEYTSSSSSYAPPYDRWGDYSLTRVDPEDGMTLWTIQEYVRSSDVWGTRVAKLRAPAPPAPTGVSGPGALGAASTNLTVTGPATNGVGYFDPGPAFSRRLSANITGCGITVNGVTSVAPGSVGLDVNTTAASPGAPCNVAITNPDGQSATTNALFSPGNRTPVANPDGPFQLTCCAAFNGSSVLGNDTDGDGDPLTAVKVTDPAHGTVALAPAGTFTYTPATGFSGNDSFTYAATDGHAQSAPAVVSLTVAAAPSSGLGSTGGGGTGTGGGTTTSTGTTTAPTGGTTTPSVSTGATTLKLTMTFSGRARLARLLRSGVAGSIKCGKACTVRLTLRIPRSLARRMHARTIVGTARVTVTASGSKRVRIRLTRSARQHLRSAVKFSLTLRGSAFDAAGHGSTAKKTVAVRR
ncbi:MAG: cadherin-like domain-containing protein, partial [Myxococcales bacterium]